VIMLLYQLLCYCLFSIVFDSVNMVFKLLFYDDLFILIVRVCVYV
jgi:hypothetical protein